MITVDLVHLHLRGSPYTGPIKTRGAAEEMVAYKISRDPSEADKWELLPVKSCTCCGEPGWENERCTKHQDRTPCVVEGCRRTTKIHSTYFVCGQHWRAYVPPGCPERRALNRLARMAKKLGYARTDRWPEPLERRWWRVWDAVARRVQRRSAQGFMDQAEIERMFGWSE